MTAARQRREARRRRVVGGWLLAVAILVFAMVVVGGATRLTESGLSIVEWAPVSGILPPLNDEAWAAAFDAYRQTPEYRLVNRGMSLDAFKRIYWWEYAHRLLGRLIGLAYGLPFLYLLWRRKVPAGLAPRLWTILGLGALQGAVGWWMVASGLVARPDVSHYRLAVHLSLALVIFAALWWTALGLLTPRRRVPPAAFVRGGTTAFLVLLAVQVVAGALVAGSKAGFAFNTWPLMEGALVPPDLFAMTPWYANLTENILTMQFMHRLLAYGLVALGLWLGWTVWRREADKAARWLGGGVLAMLVAQVGLGIWTLLAAVPVWLGTLHQAGAVAVLTLALALRHRLQAPS
ncbi:MAG: heme A synthase [Alphaproteobacteria bacterium]|nr:MAG: heme A synthase [Alphaproteobacteria bacterium]